jgi:biopolymer transport protein ExbB/TolQ
MKRRLPSEFLYQVAALLISAVVVHTAYVGVVRPAASAVLQKQRELVAADPDYAPERSVYVVLRDLEQETCFILMLWALAIMGYKGVAVWQERGLLERRLIRVPEGVRILPEDWRTYARDIGSLSEREQQGIVPRCLLAALHRFAATKDVFEVASTVHAVCESEGERLESELSMIRYIAWAIPSIGFIGTVRGIGEALGLAHRAMEGDITGVTESLGVAFNSTFVALVLSLVLMFLVHQLQLQQERLVMDTETYCDRDLIRNLAVRS